MGLSSKIAKPIFKAIARSLTALDDKLRYLPGYKTHLLANSINLCDQQRVDFVGIGDSNQIQDGTGWDHGWQFALDDAGYQQYATGLIAPKVNAAAGYKSSIFAMVNGASTGAPSELEDLFGFDFPLPYNYIASGSSESASSSRGLILDADSPLDVNANLTFEFHTGTFDSGSGEFRPRARRNNSPYSGIATYGSVISTNTGSFSTARHDLNISAATRNYPILGGFAVAGSSNVSGPFLGGYIRAINTDRDHGWSYHTLYYGGGQSLKDMAASLIAQPDAQLAYYFSEVRRNQGASKKVVFTINSGVNDRNESDTSVGPNPDSDGDSPEAYADNMRALILRIEEVWDDNGWDFDNEVVIVVQCSHEISEPNDAELLTYYTAAITEAANYTNVCVLRLDQVTRYQEFIDNSWYKNAPSDVVHLAQAGYENVMKDVMDRSI